MSKSKSYRGQRKKHRYCGCYYCVGNDKQEINNIKESIIDEHIRLQTKILD